MSQAVVDCAVARFAAYALGAGLCRAKIVLHARADGQHEQLSVGSAWHSLTLPVHLIRLGSGQLSAVDRNSRARDEAAVIGTQPQDCSGDFVGRAQASHRSGHGGRRCACSPAASR